MKIKTIVNLGYLGRHEIIIDSKTCGSIMPGTNIMGSVVSIAIAEDDMPGQPTVGKDPASKDAWWVGEVGEEDLIALHDEITARIKTKVFTMNVRLYTAANPVPTSGIKVDQRYIDALDRSVENITPFYDKDMQAPDGTMGAYVKQLTIRDPNKIRTFEKRIASTGGENPPSVWMAIL